MIQSCGRGALGVLGLGCPGMLLSFVAFSYQNCLRTSKQSRADHRNNAKQGEAKEGKAQKSKKQSTINKAIESNTDSIMMPLRLEG